jgi:predicted nucleotidyltransferase
MKAAGVIVEYNPFHNGHYYHLQGTKDATNADVFIAVMSGNFLQRGEPALVSKWARTKMALHAGIDLVVELPYCFATGKAEIFSNGAISVLSSLFVSDICFGSEHGTIKEFNETVTFMQDKKHEFDQLVKKEVAKGLSFPKASSKAYDFLEKEKYTVDLSKPNNILGYHVKAIREQNSDIQATTLKRTGAGYHDEQPQQNIASATGIRKILLEKNILEEIQPLVPQTTFDELITYYNEYEMFHHWDVYFPYLQYKLAVMHPNEIRHIYEAEEGLEYRVIQHIHQAKSFKDFMEKIKTKRYTWTRLQRFLTHILTHTTKEEMSILNSQLKTNYIRLLGMSQKGQAYLNKVKKDVDVPIITKVPTKHQDPMLQLDIKASKAYAMGYDRKHRSKMLASEFVTSPIRM